MNFKQINESLHATTKTKSISKTTQKHEGDTKIVKWQSKNV